MAVTRAPQARRRKARYIEDRLHIACASYLRCALPDQIVWWHTPNGGARSKSEAAKLKAMGVLPGVADFVLIMPNGQAAFIELKIPANKLLKQREGRTSEEQDVFSARVTRNGCAYAIVRTLEELEAVITRWLALFGLTPRARAVIQPRLTLRPEGRL